MGSQDSKYVLSFLLYIPFPAGNITVYTPSQGTNREKYFINYCTKVKMPTPAGKKHLFYPTLTP